jgi:hypothetical protein
MKRLLILFLLLLMGLTFELMPRWNGTFMEPDPFPFYDFKYGGISWQTYWWMIAEKLSWIILVLVVVMDTNEYRRAAWIFFALSVCDLVDYLLFYNRVWLHFGSLPVSMNTVSAVVFGFVILREWMQHKSYQ